MVQILNASEAFKLLCKSTNKWGMYISWYPGDDINYVDPKEVYKAAPYLNFDDHTQLLVDAEGFLLFDTEEEMCHYYNMTVGDDGPTHLNPYDGPLSVYARTCNPNGELLNENT